MLKRRCYDYVVYQNKDIVLKDKYQRETTDQIYEDGYWKEQAKRWIQAACTHGSF